MLRFTALFCEYRLLVSKEPIEGKRRWKESEFHQLRWSCCGAQGLLSEGCACLGQPPRERLKGVLEEHCEGTIARRIARL